MISAVNLTEGGPLSILKDAVKSFVFNFGDQHNLIVLVHNKKLLGQLNKYEQVKICEYQYPKRAWLFRLWFEYVHCYFISKRLKPDFWLSLHDITPNVHCRNKIVYCHNPAPFYKPAVREIWIEKPLIFFYLFYDFFYRINIRSNRFIIVQQQWMRDEFIRRYKVNNIIVSYPEICVDAEVNNESLETHKKYIFIYPSLPRVFKNFEVLLSASAILETSGYDFEVIFTFNGNENKYAARLVSKYKHLSSVKFIGIQKREDLEQLYTKASCLVFASKMETWGLPISEMRRFNKPMILVNKKYARETIQKYEKVSFFEPENARQLAQIMEAAINNTLLFEATNTEEPSQPFAKTWVDLYRLIFANRF